MPLGGQVVAHARAVLSIDRGDFTHDLNTARGQFHRYAGEQERDLTKLSARQVRAARLQREYTESVARFGPASARTVRALERLKFAEEGAARSSGHASRQMGLFGRRSSETGQHAGRLGRGVLAGSGAFRGLGRSVAFASSYFLGGAGIVYGLRAAVGAASDLEEQVSKTNVVFGANGREVIRWSKTLATSFGISQRSALTYAGSFGALLRPLGIRQGPAAKISQTLTERAADIASFYNTSEQDALQAIQSGLVGQVRPLRRFGVQLSEDRIKAFAFTSGIAKADVDPRAVSLAQDRVAIATEKVARARKKYGANSLEAAQAELTLKKAEDQLHKALGGSHTQLTAAQKTLARYQIIMKDSALAGGDFARTSGHLAQQQKILRAQIDNITESVGKALIPAVTRYTRQLTRWLGQSRNQARVTRDVKSAVHVLGIGIDVAAGAVRRIVGGFRLLNRVTGGTRHTIWLLGGAFAGLKLLKFIVWFQQTRRAIFGIRAASLATIPALEALAVAEAEAGAAGGVGGKGLLARGLLGGAGVGIGLGVAAAVAARAAQQELKGRTGGALHDVVSGKGLVNRGGGNANDAARQIIQQNIHDPGDPDFILYNGATWHWNGKKWVKTAAPGEGRDDRHNLASEAASRQAAQRIWQRHMAALRARRDGKDDGKADDTTTTTRRRFHERAQQAARLLIPRAITDAVERAKLTKGYGDDLKALGAEERYIKRRLEHTKRNTKLYSDLLHALVGVHGKIEAIHNKQKKQDEKELSARAQERQAFLAQQMGFFSEFAPDIFRSTPQGLRMGSQKAGGGKTVIVNQNFLAPPESHFVNFHQARFAAQHAL
jgi:hypothetical protein